MLVVGNYMFMVEDARTCIYHELEDGTTISVFLDRYAVSLCYAASGEITRFTRWRRGTRWYWQDSRIRGPVTRRHVLGELARMLYNGNEAHAESVVAALE